MSFTDDSTQYYDNDDYIVDESPIGKVFIPKKDVDIIGEVGIRYEKHPWMEQFEFDGLHPRTPVREGYGLRGAKACAESLSKIYAKAFDDYTAMCSDKYVTADNEDGLNIEAYFSNAAEHFVGTVDQPESIHLYRKFCGLTENIWRDGTKAMHDIAVGTMLPIIWSNSEATRIFYDTVTPEFREYIEENDYGKKES